MIYSAICGSARPLRHIKTSSFCLIFYVLRCALCVPCFDISGLLLYYGVVNQIQKTIQKPRINNEITAPELRVIDSEGKNLGVLPRKEALALARPEEGFDLIEISASANPPVARVMSFDKYRYERDRAEKKERQLQKAAGTKRVQISVRAAEHDLLTRVGQLEKFLEEGHQVEVYVRLRGREKYNRQWAEKKLGDFLKMIKVEYKTMGAPRFAQGLSIQITKR